MIFFFFFLVPFQVQVLQLGFTIMVTPELCRTAMQGHPVDSLFQLLLVTVT